MINQKIRQDPAPVPYRYQGSGGIDPVFQRLLNEMALMQQMIDFFKDSLDRFRVAMAGSSGLARAFRSIENSLENLLPLWTPGKHQALTECGIPEMGFYEPMDWLRRFDPPNATLTKASALARRALAFARRDFDGQPNWNDNVVELLHKRRVRRYFLHNYLRLVYTYHWTTKTAKIAEAQWQIKEHGALVGPVSVPKTRARGRKSGE